MMGDRDYRQLIKNAIDAIGRDIEPKIDPKDNKTIFVHEIVRCLRRSYFDRIEPIEVKRTSFNNLMSGLLQKMEYGGKEGEFPIEDITLKGKADMIVDDAVIIFRSSLQIEESPIAADLLYLNACMWIFNKIEGIRGEIFVGQSQKKDSQGQVTGLKQKEQKQMIEDFKSGKNVAEEVLIIPLFPQYSESTIAAAIDGIGQELKNLVYLSLSKNPIKDVEKDIKHVLELKKLKCLGLNFFSLT